VTLSYAAATESAARSIELPVENEPEATRAQHAGPDLIPASGSIIVRDVTNAEGAREVQRRLATLGYFDGNTRGSWGPRSRAALVDFKAAHQLPPNDMWDKETEAVLFSARAHRQYPFVGAWAADVSLCSAPRDSNDSAIAIIHTDRARAGTSSCTFRSKRQVGTEWSIHAKCTSSDEKWTANIRLAVLGARLTWASERGTEEYVRCKSRA